MSKRAWIALGIIVLVTVEAGSAAVLFVARRYLGQPYDPIRTTSLAAPHKEMLERLLAGETTYYAHSPTLGWTIKPNGYAPLYRANAQGIRGNRIYRPTPPRGVLRLAAFGDSFTHGDDVRNQDTWEELLVRAHGQLEVMNFGVSGYGSDQAFLRYREEGLQYRPQITIIGFLPEDAYRNVNVFRPFYYPDTGLPLAKPRFVLRAGRLVLIENPMQGLGRYRDLLAQPERILPQLGIHDHYYQVKYKPGSWDFLSTVRLLKLVRYALHERSTERPEARFFNPDAEAFRVTAAILDLFVDTVAGAGSVPIILIFPAGRDIIRFRRTGSRQYTPMLEHIRAKGYRYIDLLDWFEAQARDVPVEEIAPSHYSVLGHGLVAGAVWRYLQEEGLANRGTTP
ncbi:MAG TPA: SGNH/GDSL hydrolase family protein [bacterium]